MDIKTIRRENLRKLATEEGSTANLARKLGMDDSQISQIIGANPTRGIGDRIARRVEEVYEKPSGWLDWLNVETELQRQAILNRMKVEQPFPPYGNLEAGPQLRARLPLISWVQAGQWSEVVDVYPLGVGEEFVYTDKAVSPTAYALRIRGDSMENPAGKPTFPEGVIIIVDPARQAEHGKCIIVRLDDSQEATFKQLQIEGGRYYLKPLNPRYPIMELTGNVSFCGVVVQAIMDVD